MDPLVKKLNQRIASKVANQKTTPGVNAPGKLNFDDVLQAKRSDNTPSIEKMVSEMHETKGDMQVLSAEGIEVSMNEADMGASTNFNAKDKFFDIFSKMNQDMVSLDSSIEVLSDPNVKLSRRQLLAYQAGIGNMTINTELFSRMAQSVSKNLNTLLQTNIG